MESTGQVLCLAGRISLLKQLSSYTTGYFLSQDYNQLKIFDFLLALSWCICEGNSAVYFESIWSTTCHIRILTCLNCNFRSIYVSVVFFIFLNFLMIFIFSNIAGLQCSVNFIQYSKETQSHIHI